MRPYLRAGWTASEAADGVWVKNDGLGTALFEKMELVKDGSTISIQDVSNGLVRKGINTDIKVVDEGSSLPKEERFWLIKPKESLGSEEEQRIFWDEIKDIQITIVYKSFYNQYEDNLDWVIPNPIDGLVRPKPARKP